MSGPHLLDKIEDLRSSLVSQVMTCQYDLQHPEVIKISQELDIYLIKYAGMNFET
ncbi:aspartyl-phosphate phosphatase Spo0E family protein [Paenibacillus tarimensis]